ncbi:MAG: TetR/AcrR family transcriptional regulator [Chloroflexi bacterium]|nr:MAG: TetR/AcrR family transcriptional regulator [Chloroflexota bacterium]
MTPAEPGPRAADRRSRPLRADARRNRERVLEAAELVLASEGMSVPIDEVARRAGVGVGTVYRQFPTKEALFEAILLRRLERLLEEARSRGAAADPGEAFFGFLEHLVEVATSKRDLADALSRAGIDIEASVSSVIQELAGALEELLGRAQRSGAVRDDVGTPELFGLVAGTCMAADRRFPAACTPQRMLGIVFDGLRPAGRRDGG